MTRSLKPSEKAEDRDSDVIERQAAAAALQATIAPANRAPASVPAAPAAPRVEKPLPFEFQKELSQFAELKAKVLPSPEERAARESLLKDARFLRSLSQRLMKIPLMALGEQDIAIDALVDALKEGDKEVASAAISDIVGDKQVENESLPAPQREQLAGIKAELLYHWTAIEPTQADQVGKMLPGPVSKKIWNNVVEAQKNNLAESAAEAGR